METVFQVFLVIVGVLASLVTVMDFIASRLGRSAPFQDHKEFQEVRRRRRKLLRLLGSLVLIGTATLIATSMLMGQIIRPVTRHMRILSTGPCPTDTGPCPWSRFGPSSIAWSSDGKQIATADEDSGEIQVWDVSTVQAVITYQPPTTYVSLLAWSPDGAYLAINANGNLSILQVVEKTLHPVPEQDSFFLSWGSNVISWSPDGTQIALISELDTNIYVWNVRAGHIDKSRPPLVYSHHKKAVLSLCWSPDGGSIASASLDNTIQIWNLKRGDTPSQVIHVDALDEDLPSIIPNVAWSPDGWK